jgi:hypothetical protein
LYTAAPGGHSRIPTDRHGRSHVSVVVNIAGGVVTAMQPNWITTVVVALVVVLAGCAGMGGGDGADPTPTPSETVDPAAAGSDGAGGDGRTVSDPERVLREAGSFTATWTYEVGRDGETESRLVSERRVDLGADRSSERLSTEGADGGFDYERYYADGTAYTRFGDGEESFYQVAPQEVDPFAEALSRAVVDADSETDEFEDATYAGSETFDGVSVGRYRDSRRKPTSSVVG